MEREEYQSNDPYLKRWRFSSAMAPITKLSWNKTNLKKTSLVAV